MKYKLSIIIVDYKADQELKACLKSIKKKSDWEIIVVDNNKINRGFARGCNLGVKKARGKYLLFLNPDVVVKRHAIEKLIKKIETDSNIGIIGPQLLNDFGKPYLSFTKTVTRINAPIVYSFINTLWPNNKISRDFWFKGKSLDKQYSAGEISGAAMMMTKSDFASWGKFDERFFLYWEDIDLCKRAIDSGKRVLFYPQAQMIHKGGKSSEKIPEKSLKWFKESRFKYFKKHFGTVYAILMEEFLRLGEGVRTIIK